MSCDAVSLSITLWMAAMGPGPVGTPALSGQLAITAPLSVAHEPLFAGTVGQADGLKKVVEGFRTMAPADASELLPMTDFDEFSRKIAALSALDENGRLALVNRGATDDLKCILHGISQDPPVKLKDVSEAKMPKARDLALRDMVYLLNDNVEVITSPPQPAA